MNANEMAAKSRPQLNRIQNASRCIRLITQYGLPLLILIAILFELVLPNCGIFAPERYWGKLMLPFTTLPEGTQTNTIYALYLPQDTGPAPTQIVFPEVTRTNTIDLLYLRQPMVPAPIQPLKTGFFNFSIGRIDFGLLLSGIIIFIIAWIMDEGRKIQEEQELTV